MFVVNGGMYALTAPIFGSICDRYRSSQMPINFLGVTFTTIAFLFLGPAPFFGLPTLLPVCVAALVLHGCGNGSVLVSSFVIAHTEAIASGFSDIGNLAAVLRRSKRQWEILDPSTGRVK